MYGLAMAALLIAVEFYYTDARTKAKNTERLLQEMVTAIETRDLHDPGHGKRVAHMTAAIARHLHLGPSHVEQIRLTGHLHDIGKLHGSFAELLGRAAPLSATERVLIESHTLRGAEFVGLFQDLQHLGTGICAHHENWDGTGYPHGIAASEIPISARIVRIADSLDAMFHNRPYRAARPVEEVRLELLAGRGRQYDPSLVDVVASPGCWEELLLIAHPDRRPKDETTGGNSTAAMLPQLFTTTPVVPIALMASTERRSHSRAAH